MEPIPRPLVNVAVHVVESPGVRGITPHLRSSIKGRPFRGPIVRPPLEIRLRAAQRITEIRSRPVPDKGPEGRSVTFGSLERGSIGAAKSGM